MLKLKIEVEILKISVRGKLSGYFDIDYRYRINGEKWIKDNYNSSWSSQTNSHFRHALKKRYAVALIMNHVAEQI